MAISVICPQCDFQFHVPDEFAGKKGKCPQCREVIQANPARHDVPAAPRPAAATVAAVAPAAPVAARRSAPPVPEAAPSGGPGPIAISIPAAGVARAGAKAVKGGRRKRSSAMPAIIGSVALVAVAAIAVGAYFALNGQNADSSAAAGKQVAAGESKEPAKGSTERAKPSPPAESPSVLDDALKTRMAQTLEEIRDGALVIIETPLANNQGSIGAGFFINDKGWIVTNNHVIANANENTTVSMSNKQKFQIAGLVAVAPERDLAIIALKEKPQGITVADISFTGDPKLASPVIAFGHPHNTRFTLTKGIVSAVTTTDNLDPNLQRGVVGQMKAPADHVWIQTEANISPGNSGGPLVDENTKRVVGVITWVNQQTHLGYASHVMYVRELLNSATGEIKPFGAAPQQAGNGNSPGNPPGNAPPGQAQLQINPAAIGQRLQECAAFDWKPSTPEQYAAVSELALQITLAKAIQQNPQAGEMPAEAIAQAAAAADRGIAELSKVQWSPERIAAINRAMKEHAQPMHGVLIFGQAAAQVAVNNTPAVVVRAMDTNELFTVPRRQAENGQLCLVLGMMMHGQIQVEPLGPAKIVEPNIVLPIGQGQPMNQG